MTKNKKKIIDTNMDDVIKTSKEMRNYLLNENLDLELRTGKLKIFKTALEANKNIVSASVIQVNIENFKL
jgi:hypothetical protein